VLEGPFDGSERRPGREPPGVSGYGIPEPAGLSEKGTLIRRRGRFVVERAAARMGSQ